MTPRSLNLTDPLFDYVLSMSLRETPVQKRLREETQKLPTSDFQISADQGQAMNFLVRLIGGRRGIEVGTYTGYSALAMALALPGDGQLICCDINPETTGMGQKYWAEAGVAGKIDLRIAPAIETLDSLLGAGGAGTFDFGFIDADKPNYDAYYERVLKLLRRGGLVMIDNVLWGGSVADKRQQDASTKAIRALNEKIHDDARVDICLLSIGDGLTLAMKR